MLTSKSSLSYVLCCNLVNFSRRMESKVSFGIKISSVCALEPEKITKTKWAQKYGTPCKIYSPQIAKIEFHFKHRQQNTGSLSLSILGVLLPVPERIS